MTMRDVHGDPALTLLWSPVGPELVSLLVLQLSSGKDADLGGFIQELPARRLDLRLRQAVP